VSAAARKSLAFVKYSGAGNDFIIVDSRAEPSFSDGAAAARALCRRGVAVGADGLAIVTCGDDAGLEEGIHGRMQLWNADGSRAEFSGNAARCVVRFLSDEGLAGNEVRLQTDVGVVDGRVDGRVVAVTVPGGGSVWPQRRLRVEGRDLIGTYVHVGVPFFVVLHDDPDDLPVRFLGRAIRNHADLKPAGANVDFVRVDDEQELYFRVYERGVEDETLSSGTGSIAAALAAAAADRAASPVACNAAGGTLMVRFRPLPAATHEPEPEPAPEEPAPPVIEESDAIAGETPVEGEEADTESASEEAADTAESADEFELPRIADGPPLEYVEIEVEGDTRRVMDGSASADALRIR
jgi:diaminopimelate epimerase